MTPHGGFWFTNGVNWSVCGCRTTETYTSLIFRRPGMMQLVADLSSRVERGVDCASHEDVRVSVSPIHGICRISH